MSHLISRTDLQRKIAARQVTVVEALPPKYFNDKHLPGALNLPHDQVAGLAPRLLPDKDAEIVVYCANAACQNSALAGQALRDLGYSQVLEYKDGKQDWVDAGLAVETSAQAAE